MPSFSWPQGFQVVDLRVPANVRTYRAAHRPAGGMAVLRRAALDTLRQAFTADCPNQELTQHVTPSIRALFLGKAPTLAQPCATRASQEHVLDAR